MCLNNVKGTNTLKIRCSIYHRVSLVAMSNYGNNKLLHISLKMSQVGFNFLKPGMKSDEKNNSSGVLKIMIRMKLNLKIIQSKKLYIKNKH